MQSSKLLFALCETKFGEEEKFITFNDESKEDENGTLFAFMSDICYSWKAGEPRVGVHYLMSNTALMEAFPDLIFSNDTDGGKTSMFGYAIDDYHK